MACSIVVDGWTSVVTGDGVAIGGCVALVADVESPADDAFAEPHAESNNTITTVFLMAH